MMSGEVAANAEDDTAEKAWRCETCGRWSHASRRPSYHKRMVLDTDEIFDDDNEQQPRILQTFEGRDPETGAWDASFYIACGPFAEYRLERA